MTSGNPEMLMMHLALIEMDWWKWWLNAAKWAEPLHGHIHLTAWGKGLRILVTSERWRPAVRLWRTIRIHGPCRCISNQTMDTAGNGLCSRFAVAKNSRHRHFLLQQRKHIVLFRVIQCAVPEQKLKYFLLHKVNLPFIDALMDLNGDRIDFWFKQVALMLFEPHSN